MDYRFRGGPKINYGKCIGCKKCYEICPADIFEFDRRTKLVSVAHPDECWYCGACIYDCLSGPAIELELPLACC